MQRRRETPLCPLRLCFFSVSICVSVPLSASSAYLVYRACPSPRVSASFLLVSASLCVSPRVSASLRLHFLGLPAPFLRFSASLFSTSLFEYPCVFASFCVFSKLLLCTSWALCASHYVYIRLSASSLLLCSGVSLRLYVSLRLSASRGISVHLFVPLRLSAPSTSLCVSLGVTPLSTMSVRHLHIWYIVRLLCISWCLLRPLCISRCHLRLSVDTKRRRLSEKSV